MRYFRTIICLFLFVIVFVSCANKQQKDVINIGYIGPLTGNAKALGAWPAKALQLAVDEYNSNKDANMPVVNLHIKDDAFEDKNALPLYNDLKQNSDVDIVFISNSGGTVAIADQALKDGVLVVNPLNNDELLNTMNENVFRIAKKTEEMAQVISYRLIELDYKKVLCIYFQNDFMSRITNKIVKDLQNNTISVSKVGYDQKVSSFKNILNEKDAFEADAIVFGGYIEIAYAMKELREAGVTAPFYSINNTIPTPAFYEKAGVHANGTEFAFFTSQDGNYMLGEEFMARFKEKFGELPPTIWSPMQAYDAMNIVLNAIKDTKEKPVPGTYVENLKHYLHATNYHNGVTGNIRITEDGSSRGIYFSLYNSLGEGQFERVKR